MESGYGVEDYVVVDCHVVEFTVESVGAEIDNSSKAYSVIELVFEKAIDA